MDIERLVLGSVFLLVLFIGDIFLVLYIGYKARVHYGEAKENIKELNDKVQELTDAYTKDIKNILENQVELIKTIKK